MLLQNWRPITGPLRGAGAGSGQQSDLPSRLTLELYGLFLDLMRVASAHRAQVANPAVGAPKQRASETARPLVLALTRGELRTQSAHSTLQGHRQATGIGQQLQVFAHGQQLQANQQARVAAALILEKKFPTFVTNLKGFSEAPTTAVLGAF
jgi:hypothetical protein